MRGDNPIRLPGEDVLGRTPLAVSFARQVLELEASEGVVVGVLGPWGSGKTSFVNLACSEFEKAGVPVLNFNPWMFSGAEQLVERFFVELALQLRIRPGFAEIGKNLEYYGSAFSGVAWLPVAGPWIDRARKAAILLGGILQRHRESAVARRAKIEGALAGLDEPILVVLDDVDRLSVPEIRDVFKLVRLTASFPNVIYILAFDRPRVEGALAEQGLPGRAYLEKILQVAIDLPAIPEEALERQILEAVQDAVTEIQEPGPFDEGRWPDVLAEIVLPLVHNMRDVRRYASAVRGSVKALGGQIALVDVLALEAVRVFLPDVFARLHSAVEGLTTTAGFIYSARGDPPQLRADVDALLEAGKSHAGLVRAMITRLFPAAERHIGGSNYHDGWMSTWLREHRVAHGDILRLYLERVAGEGLRAFTAAERAWALMNNRAALDSYLRSLDRDSLQDVIASLGIYEDQFAPEHVVPATIVLLNLLPELPERRRGMFELPARYTVGKVVYRLLRSLRNPADVEGAVRRVLEELASLSSKLELITIVGYREGAGHRLVSEGAAAEFERSWRDEVRASGPQQLSGEWDALMVLLRAKREVGPTETPLIIDNGPELTLALLRAGWGDALRQSLGSRTVRRSPQLAWDALVDVFGDEATLRQRIESLKAAKPEGADELLALAEKYLSGWRPSPPGTTD